MGNQESSLTNRDATHQKLMSSILKGISDTPLVLKGGTSLLLAYGLDRFSEDLDFDSPIKLNLESRIKHSVPKGIELIGIDSLKDTSTVTRYRVRYQSEYGARSLKLEISYRTPTPESEIRIIRGFKVASLRRIIDQKLNAAHDGEDVRSKVRDLFDLDFIARQFPVIFTPELSLRLKHFAEDPDVLVSRYRADYEEDDLVLDTVDLEHIALNLHYAINNIIEFNSVIEQRVNDFSKLNDPTGSAYLFWNIANKAIKISKDSNGDIYEADWKLAEKATIIESIGMHGKNPDDVANILCLHSPASASPEQQAVLKADIERMSPELQVHFEKKRKSSEYRQDSGMEL